MNPRLQDLPVGDQYRRAEMHFSRGMLTLACEEFAALLTSPSELPVELAAEVRWRMATCLVGTGRLDEAEQCVDTGLELAGISERSAARLASVRGYAALARGEYEEALETLRASVDALRNLGDAAGLAKALRWLAQTHLRQGNLEPAFEAAYCALAETRHLSLESDAGSAHGILCVAFIQRGQYDAAMEHGKQALDISTRLGHQNGVIRHNLHLSIAVRLSGDLEGASRYALRALAAAEENDAPTLAISARLAAARALRESGRLDAARELVEGALEICKTSQRERDHVLVLEDLGDLDLAAGNLRAALEKYRRAWRRAESIAAEGDLVAELGWRIGFALMELGDLEGAEPWLTKSLAVCLKAGERKEHALALRARGMWHARGGREQDAREDLLEALAALETLNVPFEIARTHLAVDAALAECGSDARPTLEERRRHLGSAHHIFERLGAVHLLRQTEEAQVRVTSEDGTDARVKTRRRSPRGAVAVTTAWESPAFNESLDECRKLGPTSLPILLIGETGTGKTLLAEALHDLGRGEEGEFLPVNCAALPEHLQESELFGHRKGAFTGAEREHPGIFREAGRGTVFLDEIDKTSMEFQAKLLHVLDTREVRPIGTTRTVPVEARIICATNRDLFALVREGKFLEDMHHRLMGGVIEVPALRNRVEDLRVLADILLREVCALERTPVPELDESAWRVLAGHDWPGNVRELKSLLHRTVALNRDRSTIDADTLLHSAPRGSTLRTDRPSRVLPANDLAQRMASAERDEILHALEKADGVRRRAAEILGISYRGLGKKMARLGIEGARARK
ncbi:sigma 54-interacting transcriptional regulator [bacterium]|nr:sigma 54-interacting transcriptional regulator [bacterium]